MSSPLSDSTTSSSISSLSSQISPTISSRTSSIVTIPRVPLYSSVTMARCCLASLRTSRTWGSFAVLYTKHGSFMISSIFGDSPAAIALRNGLRCITPIILSMLLRYTGRRLFVDFDTCLVISLKSSSISMASISTLAVITSDADTSEKSMAAATISERSASMTPSSSAVSIIA